MVANLGVSSFLRLCHLLLLSLLLSWQAGALNLMLRLHLQMLHLLLIMVALTILLLGTTKDQITMVNTWATGHLLVHIIGITTMITHMAPGGTQADTLHLTPTSHLMQPSHLMQRLHLQMLHLLLIMAAPAHGRAILLEGPGTTQDQVTLVHATGHPVGLMVLIIHPVGHIGMASLVHEVLTQAAVHLTTHPTLVQSTGARCSKFGKDCRCSFHLSLFQQTVPAVSGPGLQTASLRQVVNKQMPHKLALLACACSEQPHALMDLFGKTLCVQLNCLETQYWADAVIVASSEHWSAALFITVRAGLSHVGTFG